MIYNVRISDGYIEAVCSTLGNENDGNISEEEYAVIVNAVLNKPSAEEGFDYRLKTDLSWEPYVLPAADEDGSEEANIEDLEAALAELGVC